MSTSPSLKPAILIISQTASADPSTDSASAILTDVFERGGDSAWSKPEIRIVSDDVHAIQAAIQSWTDHADAAVNLIITSGGTGFAEKDVTPEAVAPLLHKHASGLVHGLLAASLAVTPFAIMARPVAGVRHKTLILTLPGSPKGAKENLQAVIKLLPHACQQAAGADSRQLHTGGVEKLERDAGLQAQGRPEGVNSDGSDQARWKLIWLDSSSHSHSHHHHHHHSHDAHTSPQAHTVDATPNQTNNPALGPTRRHRSSPYPMLSVEEALQRIAQHTPAPRIVSRTVDHSIVGFVLAEDVRAAEAVPAFRASIVDGYAVRIPEGIAKNPTGTYRVSSVSHAHAGKVPELEAGTVSRITTGAALPPGSNAVVMVEDTVLKSMTDDEREEAEVEILTDQLQRGENIREIGSDVAKGEVVMRRGEGITSVGGEFGLLASVGTRRVKVYHKPRIGVLSTGDEIVPHDREGYLRLGEVRDTNRPTLVTAIRAQGYEAIDLGIASDKPGALEARLRAGLESVDVLITSGGVSMGELDLLKPTIERALKGTIHFGRVAMKPGKPTTFASVATDHGDKLIFSLPGNPASAIVTFMLFVLPSLHQASGIAPRGLPRISIHLDTPVKCDASREEYHRVIVTGRGSQGEDGLWAMSTGGQRSSRIGSFKGANALLKLPAGGGILERGAKVEALLMSAPGGIADVI